MAPHGTRFDGPGVWLKLLGVKEREEAPRSPSGGGSILATVY
jgi:hypothetical protein